MLHVCSLELGPVSPYGTWEPMRKVWVPLVGAGRDWGSQRPSSSTRSHVVAVAGPGLRPPVPDGSVHPAPRGDSWQRRLWNIDQRDKRPATEDSSGHTAWAPPAPPGLQAPGSQWTGRGLAHLWGTCASAPPWPLRGTASPPPPGLPRPDGPESPVSTPTQPDRLPPPPVAPRCGSPSVALRFHQEAAQGSRSAWGRRDARESGCWPSPT